MDFFLLLKLKVLDATELLNMFLSDGRNVYIFQMLIFGLPRDRPQVPVTSLSFNQQGDLLFAGYGDGHYTVWDVQRASVLKVVTEHKAPVVHLLYLGQDSQVTRQFNVLSGDTKGVVKLSRFKVLPLINMISLSKSQVKISFLCFSIDMNYGNG